MRFQNARFRRVAASAIPTRTGRVASAILVGLVGACVDLPLGPVDATQDTGYLAVITTVVAPPDVSPGERWTMSVREISGTYSIDDMRVISPGDTVIYTLPPASYDIHLDGLPAACSNRYGLGRRGIVYQPRTTSVVRFNIECVPLLRIATGTDGTDIDDSYVYRILDGGREIRLGTIGPNEELTIDGIDPGRYTVELTNVAPRCAVLSDGLRRQTVTVGPPASPIARFRISCSRPQFRPTMLRFEASRLPGASVLFIEATDPGSEAALLPDLDRIFWDVTACDGVSLLRNGPREFRGLRVPGSRVFGADTARIVFVLPGDIPASTGDVCMSGRVVDGEGNTTPWFSDGIGDEFGSPPTASGLDVQIVDVATDPKVRFLFSGSDPDGDLAGAFVTFELFDGTLGPADGRNEVWLPNVFGWDAPYVPDLRMVSFPFGPDDVAAVHLYLVDRYANATEYVDSDVLPGG